MTDIFNNMERIGLNDSTRNVGNTKFASYTIENYFNNNSESAVQFATQAPTVNFRGTTGGGLPGSAIDFDSQLIIGKKQDRALERLQLVQRPYLTIPYLGRGTSNPALESVLQQGERISDKRSAWDQQADDSEKSFPMIARVKDRVTNPTFSVEEAALSGWIRGGRYSREVSNTTNFRK